MYSDCESALRGGQPGPNQEVSEPPAELERRQGVSMGSFGEDLKKAREAKGVALEAIATATKITTRYLQAVEQERFDQLPGGVFRKSIVRSYARTAGLD